MKTHFAILEQPANESDNMDYWSPTWCGLEETESPPTNKEEFVTCQNCQKSLVKYPVKKFIKDSSHF